jgi:vancomycin resistance protein YoaR
VGRELSLVRRLQSRLTAGAETSIPIPVTADDRRLLRVLKPLDAPPQDASADIRNGRVVLLADRPGTKVPKEEAKLRLLEALAHGRTCVALPSQSRQAKVCTADIAAVTALRAEVSLPITSRHAGAMHNISLATTSLNSLVLMPGQSLSLNRALGPRTAGRGYRLAPILLRGRPDLGVGGGVCVVSSALFQASALAGLEIVERHSHAVRVRYTKPGMDATLEYGRKDLIVKNDTPSPIVLKVERQNRRIVARVVGSPMPTPTRVTTRARRASGRLEVITYREMGGREEVLCKSLYREPR